MDASAVDASLKKTKMLSFMDDEEQEQPPLHITKKSKTDQDKKNRPSAADFM